MKLLFALTAVRLAALGQNAVSAKDFEARGNGIADDTVALQRAFDAACVGGKLVIPSGRYNIRAPLVTKCALSVTGEGAARTVIFQTLRKTSNHGIVASYSLTLQDISIETTPLMVNKGMVAVFRKDEISSQSGPAQGQKFSFVRFHSQGFNFGVDVAGTGDADNLDSVVVKDCDIEVSTEPNAVANPVNMRNGESLTVEGSTLTGDGNNDHAIYTISVRKVLIEHNLIRNHGNSAIKLLTAGFHATACPALNNDYSSWVVRNNVIAHSKLALAAYTYCGVKLPMLEIVGNFIYDIPNTYAGDAAAIYIQANCQSAIDTVSMSGNTFQDIGLSGVFLLSSIQGGPPCADLSAEGTIGSFLSNGDKFLHFSISYPGMYSAISASGKNLLRANISQLISDGEGSGRGALNLGSVRRVKVNDLIDH